MNSATHPLLQEELWTDDLPGGGKVWVVPCAGSRCHALLLVDFGSIDGGSTAAGPLPEGIAHFLEHRLFEKPEGDIAERFTELGADVDAQTGLTGTSFSFTASAHAFDACLPLLFDLAGRPYFPEDSVARERSIITREIQLFDDSVEWVAFQTALQALYEGQRIAVDIAGTPESLARIDAEILDWCHRRYYHAGALQLIVCGPVDASAVCRNAVECVADWPSTPPEIEERPRFEARVSDLQVRRSVPRARRLLAFPDPGRVGGRELLRRELCLELGLDILFGTSSRFFSRHYESGLIDGETFGGEIHTDASHGFCLLGGDTDDPDALQEAIVEELRLAMASGWIEKDFDRAWRRAYGEMVCLWEDVESCAELAEAATLRGCHPFELVELYDGEHAVRASDVTECVADCLQLGNFATATVLPAG